MYVNWLLVNEYGMQLYGLFQSDLFAIVLIGIYIASLIVHSLIVFQGGSIGFRLIKGILSLLNLTVQGYATLILLMANNGSI